MLARMSVSLRTESVRRRVCVAERVGIPPWGTGCSPAWSPHAVLIRGVLNPVLIGHEVRWRDCYCFCRRVAHSGRPVVGTCGVV